MFMTPAITSVTRDVGSGFGLMHLNALNGSSSITSESSFGPRHFVNDEHIRPTFFDNSKYCLKDSLNSPSLRRSRATSPLPPTPRSKARSPYVQRKNTKTNKYQTDNCLYVEDDGRNLFKNNFTRNKLEVNDRYMSSEVKDRKNNNLVDIKVSKSFDSLSLYTSPCKENKKSTKKANKVYRCHSEHS